MNIALLYRELGWKYDYGSDGERGCLSCCVQPDDACGVRRRGDKGGREVTGVGMEEGEGGKGDHSEEDTTRR